MIAGHFALAAAVKSGERDVPLWALMLACQWLDVLFVPLVLVGVESFGAAPGTGGGYGNVVISADYTHSLVGSLALAALFGAIASRWWGSRAGVVLALVAWSHWLLDLIVHRADMPWLPGNLGGFPRLGLGLWERPALAADIELAIVLVGAALYWRAAVQVAARAPGSARLAHVSGAIVLASGLLVLGLDVTGLSASDPLRRRACRGRSRRDLRPRAGGASAPVRGGPAHRARSGSPARSPCRASDR